MRRDLVGTEGTTAIPGRYVVVALPDGTLRDASGQDRSDGPARSAGPDGVKEGDKVVILGAIITAKPADAADAPARGQYAPRADASRGIAAGAGWSDGTQAGRPRQSSQPKPAAAKPSGGTDAGRASGINQETVKRQRRIATRILLSPGDRYGVRSSARHRSTGRAASPATAATLWSPSSSVVSAADRDARHPVRPIVGGPSAEALQKLTLAEVVDIALRNSPATRNTWLQARAAPTSTARARAASTRPSRAARR